MCGIAGFVGLGDRDDLARMMAVVAHRGPDGEGIWLSETDGVFIGHRRLAIIDLELGQQPMLTSDETLVVTFNGEIYNHLELRTELEQLGHRFKTDHSDTEVLLHGYRQWGPDFVERLNGMWAFAIYDSTCASLFLSRDRFGQKPLYYTDSNGTFAFASELAALLAHSSVKPSASPSALQKYFAHGYVPAPNTIHDRVFKLPAGKSLLYSVRDKSSTLATHWDYVIDPFRHPPRNAEQEWADELRFLLRRSVKRRLMSDVDLGVFLSGGIDSSLIATLAQQESDDRIRTFTIGFDDPSFDESTHAKQIARRIDSNHRHQTLSLDSSLEFLPEVYRTLDEPIGDSSLLPTWLLSRMTSRDVKVALSGDGGDELFAGYDPFAALGVARLYDRIVPKPIHVALDRLARRIPVSHSNMSVDFKIKRALSALNSPPHLWGPIWMSPLTPDDIGHLFGCAVDVEELYSEAIAAWNSSESDHLVDKLTMVYVKLYLQDDILTKTDRASMMHGLEVRAPFLDFDFVDFVRRIPWNYRYRRPGRRKFLLKKAAKGLLPENTIRRAKKGFGAPVGRWLRDGQLDIDLAPIPSQVDAKFVKRKVTSHRTGVSDERLFLWSLWSLSNSSAMTELD